VCSYKNIREKPKITITEEQDSSVEEFDPNHQQPPKRGPEGGAVRDFRKWESTASFASMTPSVSTQDHLSVGNRKGKFDLRVTPIISEENLLWEESNGRTPPSDMFRSFNLKPNDENEWGMLINFNNHWSEWRIRKVEESGQGWLLGIRHNWYLVGVNDIELSGDTAVQVKEELMTGKGCELHLSQQQPSLWKNTGKEGTAVGKVGLSI